MILHLRNAILNFKRAVSNFKRAISNFRKKDNIQLAVMDFPIFPGVILFKTDFGWDSIPIYVPFYQICPF